MGFQHKSLLLFFGLFSWGGVIQGQNTLPAPEQIVSSDTVIFQFAPQKQMFWADYKGNESAIQLLSQSIRQHRSSIESGTIKVRVLGFCSSYDSFQENLANAKNRSNQVKSYFIVHEGLKEEHFRTTNSTRPWNGKTDIIAVAYLFTVSGITDPNESSVGTPPLKPEITEDPTITETAPPTETPSEKPTTKPQQPADSSPQSTSANERVSEISPKSTRPLRWAIKTNVAYLAATVANLGIEFAFGKHYSIDIPIIYSPYSVADNYQLRFLVVQPEFRYWLKSPMKGHFFGAHLHAGAFNIAVDSKYRYQSPDGFYGFGLSYGYRLPFARHWGAEFSIGAGYVHTKYDVYYNIPNGACYQANIPYNYWGLTKAEIGLVYTFGK